MQYGHEKLSILVLLDLSAAFDTIYHSILLDRLHNMIGHSGTVFNWFKSFLTNINFIVSQGCLFSLWAIYRKIY